MLNSAQSHPGRLHGEIVQWLNASSELLRSSNWGDALQLDGLDLLDVMRWPLFAELLSVARAESPTDTSESVAGRAHSRLRLLGYRAKVRLGELSARRRSAAPSSVPTVFWPRNVGHLKAHIPIAAALREMGQRYLFVVSDQRTFRHVLDRGEAAVFPDATEPGAGRRAQKLAARHAAKLSADPGVNLPPFVMPMAPVELVETLRRTVERTLPACHEAIELAKVALRAIGPKTLVVGNDITLEGRAECLVARRQGIATVCPMHGVVAGEPLQGSHRADQVLVYGERSRQSLIELGEDSARLVISGATHLVNRPRQTGQVDATIASALGLKPRQPWVLLATSGPGHSVSVEHHRQLVEEVARLSAAMPDVLFVAKLHPKDQLAFYSQAERLVPNSRLKVITPKQPGFPRDIFAWLQGCCGILTCASMAALDALLMDVPVVTMDFRHELEGIDFIDAGATLHCRTASELEQAVRRAAFDTAGLGSYREQVQKFLHESFANLDGNPARAAATAILELPGKNQQPTNIRDTA